MLLHCLDNGDNSNNGVTLGCLLTICYPSFLHLPGGGPCLLKEKPRSSVTPKVTHYLPLPSRLSQLIFCHLLFFSATLIFQTQEALLLLRCLCKYFFDAAVIRPFPHLHRADAQLPPSCHSLHHHNLSRQAPSRSTTSLYVFIWSVGLPP